MDFWFLCGLWVVALDQGGNNVFFWFINFGWLVVARARPARQLQLARYTTELKPKLSSFTNSNEPSRTKPSY
jgi:hypothetical protein